MAENQKGGGSSSLGDENGRDRFPVGMRVLAVDDDRTCIKVLENMLRSCQYHVTATTSSIKALEMLRQNRNKFDLVISDVKMPDIDGFKLLELVGLEMDLPVIMLSGHRDKELVMKGVLHGACDYLLKPVRIEELQNIWQHVVRKKIDRKDQNKAAANVEEASNMVGEGSQGTASENNSDPNVKAGQKRKEQSEEEEEDDEENEGEDEEPSTQKKPRLVWDAELHRKFIDAVNQLSLENAVPKKILDLMNVEGLTRENVASHLQKFRLGLRKATQQGNSVAAAMSGISDPYLQMGSIDGYRDFRTSSGSRRISSTTLPSYASGGIYCGLNPTTGSSMGGISSSLAQWQPVQSQNMMNSSVNNLVRNFPLSMLAANQSSSLLHSTPTSVELNQLQQSNCTTGFRQSIPIDNSTGFSVPSVFTDRKPTIVTANYPLSGLSSNHLLLQGNSPPTHNLGAFRNPSSLGAAPANTETFNTGISGSSNVLEYTERWQSAAQLSNFPNNSLPLNEALNSNQLPPNSLRFSSSASHIGNSPVDFSSTSAIHVPLEDAMGERQCQDGLLGNILQASCSTQRQSWEDHKQHYSENMSNTFNPSSSLISPNGDTSYLGQSSNQNNADCSERVDASLVGQMNEAERMKLNEACIFQQMNSPEGFSQNTFGFLDDIIIEMNKQELNGDLLDNVSESPFEL